MGLGLLHEGWATSGSPPRLAFRKHTTRKNAYRFSLDGEDGLMGVHGDNGTYDYATKLGTMYVYVDVARLSPGSPRRYGISTAELLGR